MKHNFSYLLNKWRQKKKKSAAVNNIPSDQTTLEKKLQDTVHSVRSSLGESSDFVVRNFKVGNNQTIKAALLYMDGLADKSFIQNFIMETLMVDTELEEISGKDISNDSGQSTSVSVSGKQGDFFKQFKDRIVANSEVSEINSYESLFQYLLAGDSILLLDGYVKGFAIGSKGYESRGVQEPSSQTVVRGPKDGFSEVLRTNTSLIRRRIKDPNLWVENKVIGKKTNTDVAICYINGVVNEKVVQEVKQRLDKVDIDAILESGYIEETIQDETFTPFPTIYNTERPDTICAGLLEGRVAIMVDGTPFVLLVPALFVHFFQSSEDYYQRSDVGTLVRLLRYLCFFLALLTPASYIALTTFHQEMIPTQLLVSLAAQREGVPFPAYVEALLMEITFEILREAGTRMPRAVGNAISIVGALVLGQAAVEAGIVSSAMVIVVSLTAISSFVSPTFNMAISVRILRFGFMTLAAMFGLVGIILGLIVMVLHLTSLRSFGIPYLAPMGPFIPSDQKDALVRMPFWNLRNRPKLINQTDLEREDTPSPKPPSTKQ
ncbi:spore germination protein [Aquibacillus sediminis]|uniref:spore germination protein n=1 Tax=Aquibacillus sediminis TaxID=2574734 RepID=UPI001108D0B3|nr:spore germination protein [Aquibacillus sediminis]